jgi:hypothetical protein
MDCVQVVSLAFGALGATLNVSQIHAFNAIRTLDYAVFVHLDDLEHFVRICADMDVLVAASLLEHAPLAARVQLVSIL